MWESNELQIELGSLPKGSFVNVWQNALGVTRATTAGVPAVYSGAFYLDQTVPGGCHAYAIHEARPRGAGGPRMADCRQGAGPKTHQQPPTPPTTLPHSCLPVLSPPLLSLLFATFLLSCSSPQIWECFYKADPVPSGAVPELVLGAEAAMWCALGRALLSTAKLRVALISRCADAVL